MNLACEPSEGGHAGNRVPLLDWLCPPVFWISAFLAFLVVHFPCDRVRDIFPAFIDPPTALFVRKVVFYLCIFPLAAPVISAARKSAIFPGRSAVLQCVAQSLVILAISALLVYSFDAPYLTRDMGSDYAVMSRNPFRTVTGAHHRRLLKPAIAYLFFLRGELPYFVFSCLVSFAVVFLSLTVLNRPALAPSTAGGNAAPVPVPFLWKLSIATSSFVTYELQNPGYVDGLVFVLFLAAILLPLTSLGIAAISALCLITHEMSVFVLVPLLVFKFPRRVWGRAMAVVALYFAVWAVSSISAPSGAAQSNLFLFGRSTFRHALSNPFWVVTGSFLAHKLLWLVPLAALAVTPRSAVSRDWLWPAAVMLGPIAVIPFAFDTSRLVGFGFPGVLAYASMLQPARLDRKTMRRLNVLFALNILIPSAVCYLKGPWYPRGLYGLEVDLFAPAIVKEQLWNR